MTFGHRDLITSSVALMGTTIVTAAGGFLFWMIVARIYPATEVGRATALISGITLFSSIGVFGLGTMLISELTKRPHRTDPLLPSAIVTSALLSGLLGLISCLLVMLLGHSGLRVALGSDWITAGLFVIAVSATSGSLVFDQASLGIGASHLQWVRNTVACFARLPLVACIAVVVGRNADSVLLTWIATLALSAAVVSPAMYRRGIAILRPRSPRQLRGLGHITAHHNTLNLSLTIPRMAMPVVVAAYAPGTTTAVFYITWMVASVLYLVPTHLCTALFAVAAGDADALRHKVRITIRICTAVGVVALPVSALGSRPILSMFGSRYAELGAGCLVLLGLQYVPNVVKQHYAAILRAQGAVRRAGVVCAVAAVVELCTVAITVALGGVTWACAMLGVALLIEAVYMLPTVVRTMRSLPCESPAVAVSDDARGSVAV